jgi:hypothetical protein
MTESEVQRTIVGWFAKQGYSITEKFKVEGGNKVDVLASSEVGEWRVEVKGDYNKNTAQYSVNFDTGMGQLLKSVTRHDNRLRYAIAIPFSSTECRATLSYRRILQKYSHSVVFEVLNIHIILVRDEGTIDVILPTDVRKFLSRLTP